MLLLGVVSRGLVALLRRSMYIPPLQRTHCTKAASFEHSRAPDALKQKGLDGVKAHLPTLPQAASITLGTWGLVGIRVLQGHK